MNVSFAEERRERAFRNKQHGVHSEQESAMQFYTIEELNEVLKILRLRLGRKYNRLNVDQRMGEEYKERWYYLSEENECVFDEDGECIGHKAIKNYLAHGYLPIKLHL